MKRLQRSPNQTLAQKLEANQRANEETARIILADPENYGEHGVMFEWAKKILGERGK